MGEPKIDFGALTASPKAVQVRKDYLTGKFTMKQLCDKYELNGYYLKKLVDFFGDDVVIPKDKPGRKTHLVRNHHIENWLNKDRTVEYIANQLEMPVTQIMRIISKYNLGSDKLRSRVLGEKIKTRKAQQAVPRSSRTISKAKKELKEIVETVTSRALVPIVEEAVESTRRIVPLEKRMDAKVVKRLHTMYRRQKDDVLSDGQKFRVKFDDIDFPERCPIRDVALDYSVIVRRNKRGRRKENAPVFDLRDPTKGWVRGNVCVLSWRASRDKGMTSADIHRRIADFMEGRTSSPVAREDSDAPNEIRLTIGMDQEAAITIRNRSDK